MTKESEKIGFEKRMKKAIGKDYRGAKTVQEVVQLMQDRFLKDTSATKKQENLTGKIAQKDGKIGTLISPEGKGHWRDRLTGQYTTETGIKRITEVKVKPKKISESERLRRVSLRKASKEAKIRAYTKKLSKRSD
jgi:hypothetical protein